MFDVSRRRLKVATAGALAVALAAGSGYLGLLPAGADTSAGYVGSTATTASQANVTPNTVALSGLVDGQAITLSFNATGLGNTVTRVEVRQCKAGSNITSFALFRPSVGGRCASDDQGPPDLRFKTSPGVDSLGTEYIELLTDNYPAQTHVGGTYKVNTGSAVNALAGQPDIVCDATHSCELWAHTVQPQGTDAYVHYDLTFAGKPSAPTAVIATPANNALSVSFTAPSGAVATGNAPITKYIATATPVGGGTPVAGNAATSPVTISGLTNGTAYDVTVVAENTASDGITHFQSDPSTPAAQGTPAAVPDAPVIGTATAGNAEATVTWTAPASNGSAITDYVVTPYIGATAQTPVNTGSTGTSFTVTGLTNGTAYTFTVAAINGVGTGPDSASSNAATPATVPGAPTIGTATAGNAQATVTWTAPASDGGSAVTGYKVTGYVGLFPAVVVTFSSTLTTQTITGLTNGTTYRFKVQAINAVGTGTPSAASAAVIPFTVAGAPTIGTATAGFQKAKVTWTAPASNGGSPITGYVVTPYIGFFPLPSVTFSTASTTQTITGLTSGTTYRFKVRAINAAGAGSYSLASNAVTPT